MALISTSSINEWFSHPKIKWIEHTNLVEKYAIEFASLLPAQAFSPITGSLFSKLCQWIAIFHDLGKTTTYFQEYIRSEIKLKSNLTHHALLSAVIAYWVIEDWLKKQFRENENFEVLAFLAFLVIRFHHGNLESPVHAYHIYEEQIELLKKQWDSINKSVLQKFWSEKSIPLPLEEIEQKIQTLPTSFKPQRQIIRFFRKQSNFQYYFLTNTLYSVLLDADKSAAGLQGLPNISKRIDANTIDQFRQLKGWNKPQKPFDHLRLRAYQEAVDKVSQSAIPHILNLQIPTGFGKTLTALSVAFKIMKRKNLQRIIYCLPFTAIIDQNYEEIRTVLETIYPGKVDTTLLLKHHHLSDVFYEESNEMYSPVESELLIEGWHSQLIITTFVQFFHTVIGYRNRTLRKFHRMAHSIIILDEIQSIPYKYWKVLDRLLTEFAKRFHIYFILVTATQPRIFTTPDQLSLVDAPKFYRKTNRIQLFLHIKHRYKLDEFLVEVKRRSEGKHRVIIVLNTIRSAQEFFILAKEHFQNIQFLSSHIVPKDRLARIHNMNRSERYFLVTTQIVEAGVNLDAEIVFRDWAPLDCVNQISGRCNRFNKMAKGEVHVYRLINEQGRLFSSYIYDSALLNATEKVFVQEQYDEINFLDLCNEYFSRIKEFATSDGTELLKSLANLRYTEDERAIDRFHLIEQNYEKQDVFVETDEIAQQVWKIYSGLKEISDFWERREQYLKIRNNLQNYIISVSSEDLKKNQPPVVNGMFYVSINQLEEFYDKITGYKKVGSTSIW